MYKMFDAIVSLIDIPAVGVMAGAVGAIVEAYPDGEFEVEFDADADENIVTAAVRPDQIAPAHQLKRAA